MSGLLSLLLRLSALASLVMLLSVWSGEVRADDGMHHAAAMPCHQQDVAQHKAAQPHQQHADRNGGHGCPDCRCVASGCAVAALALPLTRIPVEFTTQILAPMGVPPLLAQATTGPPTQPPRA